MNIKDISRSFVMTFLVKTCFCFLQKSRWKNNNKKHRLRNFRLLFYLCLILCTWKSTFVPYECYMQVFRRAVAKYDEQYASIGSYYVTSTVNATHICNHNKKSQKRYLTPWSTTNNPRWNVTACSCKFRMQTKWLSLKVSKTCVWSRQ